MIRAAILTYKRPNYFRITLESFIKFNGKLLRKKKIKLMVVIQDEPEYGTLLAIRNFWKYIDEVKLKPNHGIAGGYSFVMDETLRLGADFILYMEDDWECHESLDPYWSEIMDLFNEYEKVGYIRLRSHRAITSLKNKFRRDIPAKITATMVSDNIFISGFGFSWNPQIIRADVVNQIIPIRNEKEAARKYGRLQFDTAQLIGDIFHHIGEERTPKEGYVRHMNEGAYERMVAERKTRDPETKKDK